MFLKSLVLQNFRNYRKGNFTLSEKVTVLIGPNSAGKSNFLEAIFILSTGKSLRAEKEVQLINFENEACRIKGILTDSTELEVLFSNAGAFFQKKYLVNGVSKRRVDFAGNLNVVLFTPEDLDIVSGQPSKRRNFLDEILEQTDERYRLSHTTYVKALRQRNALLEKTQETGHRDDRLFAYWDELLISSGKAVSQKREELIDYINQKDKDLFPFRLIYDKSEISQERLLQYKQAELGAGVTLVGPHRDDVFIRSLHPVSKEEEDVKYFSSRGQQRLVSLELKLSQISYMEKALGEKPLLLLDDIFSELDSDHIKHVLGMMDQTQTIITTTHKEFVGDVGIKNVEMIELEKH